MIPVRFKGNEKDVVQKLCGDLLKRKPRQKNKNDYKRNLIRINEWCQKHIIIDGKSLSFGDVVKADFETLTKIVCILERENIPDDDKDFLIDYLYKERFSNKTYRLEFMDSLGITVCPYCIRNFVNSTKERTMCQFDHFFNKDKYPLLAVSFYNLIPVCSSCNHAKGENEIKYSPHDKKYKTNDLVNFDFSIIGMDYLFNDKDLKIELDGDKVFNQNIKAMMLDEVYQLHTDVVQECIKKTMIFNPDYLDYLCTEYKDLFDSKEELYKLVFGNYIDEESFGKRPLSKLMHDIYEDLFDIYYGEKFD